MSKTVRQDTPISISKAVHETLVNHIKPRDKIGKWTEEAIEEKIERESKKKR